MELKIGCSRMTLLWVYHVSWIAAAECAVSTVADVKNNTKRATDRNIQTGSSETEKHARNFDINTSDSIFPSGVINLQSGFKPILDVNNRHEPETKELMNNVPVPVTVETKVPVQVRVPIDRPYPVYVPSPYEVVVEKKVPYAVKVPVPQPYAVEKHIPVPVNVHVVKPYPVQVPQPYPVYVIRKVPYAIEKQVLVPIRVPVVRPYPVHIPYEKQVLVPVEKQVPYPVQVPVERHVPVPVEKPVPFHVEKPIPVPVQKLVPVPIKMFIPIPVKIPVPYPVMVKYPYSHRSIHKDQAGDFSHRHKLIVPSPHKPNQNNYKSLGADAEESEKFRDPPGKNFFKESSSFKHYKRKVPYQSPHVETRPSSNTQYFYIGKDNHKETTSSTYSHPTRYRPTRGSLHPSEYNDSIYSPSKHHYNGYASEYIVHHIEDNMEDIDNNLDYQHYDGDTDDDSQRDNEDFPQDRD